VLSAGHEVLCEVVGFREKVALLMPFGSVEGVGLGAKVTVVSSASAVEPCDAWLGRIVRGGERFDEEVPDGEPLPARAGMVDKGLIGSPPVVEEVCKRAFRGIDRPVELAEENIETLDMVAVFVGYQDSIDRSRVDARDIHAPEEFLRTQAGIDEDGAAAPGDYHAVSFTSARKHRAAHCHYYLCCSY